MSSPTILMELYLGGSWVDITSKVRTQAGITVTRGRTNEASDPDAGELTFTVDNSDGRFTVGKTDGPYGANFVKFVKCRYTVNGVVRYCGYVIKAPTAWKGLTTLADATITCTDLQGILDMSPSIGSWGSATISALNPSFWWQMADPEGSSSAAPSAGGVTLVGALDAVSPTWGIAIADLMTFGIDPPAGLDVTSQAQMTWTTTDAGDTAKAYLWGMCTAALSTYTLLLIYTPDKDQVSDPGVRVRSGTTGTNWLDISRTRTSRIVIGDGQSEGSTNLAYLDGFFTPEVPTLIAVSVSGTTASLIGTGASFTSSYLPSFTSGAEVSVRSRGAISHLAIIPGVMSASAVDAVRAKLLGSGAQATSTWLSWCLSQAGVATAPNMIADDPQMLRPTLADASPNQPGFDLASASGSMWVAARDSFSMNWLDHKYTPARVDLSISPMSGLIWDADSSLAYTDVSVDGATVYTSAGFPRSTRDVPGLMPPTLLPNYLAWLEGTADVWSSPRLSGLGYDLMALDSTSVAALLALDLRSRINPAASTLPPQLPSQWVYTIEGYTDTLSDEAWTLSFNTAPDPRFVLDDNVAGVLDSIYRISY